MRMVTQWEDTNAHKAKTTQRSYVASQLQPPAPTGALNLAQSYGRHRELPERGTSSHSKGAGEGERGKAQLKARHWDTLRQGKQKDKSAVPIDGYALRSGHSKARAGDDAEATGVQNYFPSIL